MSEKDKLIIKEGANLSETEKLMKKLDEIIVAIRGKEGGK